MPDVLSPDNVSKPSTPKTADDINDMFSELDNEPKEPVKIKEEKEPKETKKEDVEEKDDEIVEKDDDEELELKDDKDEVEKLDLKTDDDIDIDAPPRKKDILKDYPEIFKKHPWFEKMMYRDKAYTELFGSFDDAKEIAEKAETFKQFESQLLSGDTEQILKEVKGSDERAFNIIVDDYLPTLAKVDKEAYFHVVGNLNKRLIMEMVQEANDTNNDDLKQAALLVNQFIFGTSKFTPPQNRVDKKSDDKNNEVEQERLQYVKERFETSRDDLQSQVDKTLRATISNYIDPKGNMSSYVKKNAVADALNYLTEAIASDESVSNNLDRLWRSAFNDKFSQNSLSKIKSYYLSKAKGNLKNAILKARAEALKDTPSRSSNRVDDKEEKEEITSQVGKRVTPGKPATPKGKNQMQKGESVTDFFMRD